MDRKILFLYNGGTIGQVPEKRGDSIVLVPPKDSEVFRMACGSIIDSLRLESEIVFEFITAKDSSNMTPNDWEKLIFRIKKAQDEVERSLILGHLQRNRWNRRKTAEILGINYRTLLYKIKDHGLSADKQRP